MEDIPGKGFSHMCKQYKRYSRRFFGSFHRLRRYQDRRMSIFVVEMIFYSKEMFFEDAITASRELEITLTGKECGLEERAPMCGIPYHAVDAYLYKLVQKGYKVAIAEQMEDAKQAKGLVKREVIRVVTPGTITKIGRAHV